MNLVASKSIISDDESADHRHQQKCHSDHRPTLGTITQTSIAMITAIGKASVGLMPDVKVHSPVIAVEPGTIFVHFCETNIM